MSAVFSVYISVGVNEKVSTPTRKSTEPPPKNIINIDRIYTRDELSVRLADR